jgi:hypothetical protein
LNFTLGVEVPGCHIIIAYLVMIGILALPVYANPPPPTGRPRGGFNE